MDKNRVESQMYVHSSTVDRERGMRLFKKKLSKLSYDKENKKPIIRSSICNGEQVAGFKDIHNGNFEEIMLLKSQEDLDKFKTMYGILEEIEKEY